MPSGVAPRLAFVKEALSHRDTSAPLTSFTLPPASIILYYYTLLEEQFPMTTSKTARSTAFRFAVIALALLITAPFFAAASEPDVTFEIEGVNLHYYLADQQDAGQNPELVVQEGDTVRIELEVTQGFHDLVIDEFDAATEQVAAGNTTVVEFVADEAGTYEYYCSVGSHRAQGMYGTFIVE